MRLRSALPVRAPALTGSRTAGLVRIALLALSLALTIATPSAASWWWFGALIVLAVTASLTPFASVRARILYIVEAAIVAVAVLRTGGSHSPLLPYLVAPAFAGGLGAGAAEVVLIVGVTSAMLLVGQFTDLDLGGSRAYAVASAQWVLLALVVGLVGAWVRRLLDVRPAIESSYAQAHELLEQLRAITRKLPVGLDSVTVADELLSTLRQSLDFETGVVLVRSRGQQLVPLTSRGALNTSWSISLDDEGPLSEAWVTQEVTMRSGGLLGAEAGRVGLAVPLTMGRRTFGLVGVDLPREGRGRAAIESVREVADEFAVRLDTALLFSEIRGIATEDERQRIAREIHDGIAQELVYLGYAVDNALYDTRSGRPVEDQLASLRAEMTRLISELRMSIFDLRTTAGGHGGLGTALADHVRIIGKSSSFTVHLSLDEGPARLPTETEEELLRIAQEAINNVRKHAGARNLWVGCTVDAPYALIRVEDDGRGLPKRRREGSYGMSIMQERAAKVNATLRVSGREPTGTVVEIELGSRTPKRGASAEERSTRAGQRAAG